MNWLTLRIPLPGSILLRLLLQLDLASVFALGMLRLGFPYWFVTLATIAIWGDASRFASKVWHKLVCGIVLSAYALVMTLVPN